MAGGEDSEEEWQHIAREVDVLEARLATARSNPPRPAAPAPVPAPAAPVVHWVPRNDAALLPARAAALPAQDPMLDSDPFAVAMQAKNDEISRIGMERAGEIANYRNKIRSLQNELMNLRHATPQRGGSAVSSRQLPLQAERQMAKLVEEKERIETELQAAKLEVHRMQERLVFTEQELLTAQDRERAHLTVLSQRAAAQAAVTGSEPSSVPAFPPIQISASTSAVRANSARENAPEPIFPPPTSRLASGAVVPVTQPGEVVEGTQVPLEVRGGGGIGAQTQQPDTFDMSKSVVRPPQRRRRRSSSGGASCVARATQEPGADVELPHVEMSGGAAGTTGDMPPPPPPASTRKRMRSDASTAALSRGRERLNAEYAGQEHGGWGVRLGEDESWAYNAFRAELFDGRQGSQILELAMCLKQEDLSRALARAMASDREWSGLLIPLMRLRIAGRDATLLALRCVLSLLKLNSECRRAVEEDERMFGFVKEVVAALEQATEARDGVVGHATLEVLSCVVAEGEGQVGTVRRKASHAAVMAWVQAKESEFAAAREAAAEVGMSIVHAVLLGGERETSDNDEEHEREWEFAEQMLRCLHMGLGEPNTSFRFQTLALSAIDHAAQTAPYLLPNPDCPCAQHLATHVVAHAHRMQVSANRAATQRTDFCALLSDPTITAPWDLPPNMSGRHLMSAACATRTLRRVVAFGGVEGIRPATQNVLIAACAQLGWAGGCEDARALYWMVARRKELGRA